MKTVKNYRKKTNRKQKTKKRFLFNPNNPKKSFDVYIDKNPNDTISIKYKTYNDVINTISKLEHLYKTNKYTHKRIWQVAMIMRVRLNVIKKYRKTRYKKIKYNDIKKRALLANKYYLFLKKRTKINDDKERKQMVFK